MKLITRTLAFTAVALVFGGLALADDDTGNADQSCTTQVANDVVQAYQAGEEIGGPVAGAAAALGTAIFDPCPTAPPELDEVPQN